MQGVSRIVLFLGVCVVARSTLAYLAHLYWEHPLFRAVSLLALLPALGWLILYFTDSRLTARETFGGRMWWHQLRLPHALLYLNFVIYAHRNPQYAWVPLAADVALGLTGWTCSMLGYMKR